MMDVEDQTKPLPKMEGMVVVHNNEAKVVDDMDEGKIADEMTSFCQKTDGKNCYCKNEAKHGQAFCIHHLSLFRSYNGTNSVSYNNNNNNNNNTSSSRKALAMATNAGARRGKARATKRASSSSVTSNRYEFYYYSGFGPLWGKRRGDRIREGNNNNQRSRSEQMMRGAENSTITEVEEANVEPTQNTSSSSPFCLSSSSQIMDNEKFDYDDDEDEDTNGNSGKKRMRKPVKARSLKSLM